ncbi:unnamed protein product [Cylicocyclus nassatus]|uniref:MADF domain-containing protein n=1 Tax=Cylicocyclus nassatus TaxID=53992 RepID=A0AA36GY33_CYLNA|nr:unnamed protein product [Cylicocyclus nassatus]
MITEDHESFNEEMSFMVEEVRPSIAATTLKERLCLQRSAIKLEMKRSFDTSVYRLSDMEKHALVDIVQQNPTIWDEQQQSYKNLQARAAAWRHVADEMQVEFGKNFEAEPLQKAFKNLRDVYVRKRREYSDVLRRKSGAESGILEKIAGWPFYKQMSFLDAGTDQGERFCNVDFEDNEIIDVTEETQIVEVTETSSQSSTANNSIRPLTEITSAKKSGRKQNKGKDSLDKLGTVLKSLEPPDRFESFGQLLSSTLRELNSLDATKADAFALKVLHNLLARGLTREELTRRYPPDSPNEEEESSPRVRAPYADTPHVQRDRLANFFAHRDGYC